MNAKTRYSLSVAPGCVLLDGPQERNADGEPEWTVSFGDDGGEPIDAKQAVWRCDSLRAARDWACGLADRYGLELIDDGQNA